MPFIVHSYLSTLKYCRAEKIIPKYFTMQLSQTGFHVKDQSNDFSKLCALALMHNQKSSACVMHHIFHNTNNIFFYTPPI